MEEIFADIALATFIVNLFGVAIATVCTYRFTLTTSQRLVTVAGFAGGFTTYLAFALDLNRDQVHPRRFLANIFATLTLGIIAAGIGRPLAG